MTTDAPGRPVRLYRSQAAPGHDGFGQLLRAELTKFRTVRGWVIGMIVAVLVTAGLGVFLVAAGGHVSCGTVSENGSATTGHGLAACGPPPLTLGPGGEPVTDSFYFVRQPLAGNGSITVRVTSLTGTRPSAGGQRAAGPLPSPPPPFVPWSKAGIVIKASLTQGSAYAAMMVTVGNGVRMQWNYTGDTPGLPGAVSAASPRWLRLTRDGDTITGYDSADGAHWTRVGAVHLAGLVSNGLASTVQAGLFTASPPYVQASTGFASGDFNQGSTEAAAVFDHVSRSGAWPASTWTGDAIGAGSGPGGPEPGSAGGYHQAAGQFTVTGTGDIAPLIPGPGNGGVGHNPIGFFLLGTFVGLIAVMVVAAMFMTAEYRRGLIRTTLAASPGRGRVLAAKAIVIGAAAFVTGLVAAAATVIFAIRMAHATGYPLWPEPWPAEVRLIVGTAVLVAVSAVFALAVGTMVRRSAAAVMIAIAAIVVPFFLAFTSAVPSSIGDWLLRITPAAAFAVQQSTPRYQQVQAFYRPMDGFYPLAPWTGFAVLCAWAALALAAAYCLLRRRDA
jgi:ABC-type transport system involved in multi-copper enzyme maturation permease subunit